MQYKTMVYEMIQHQPKTYERLKKSHKLLETMENYARELKASHQAWQEMLTKMRPNCPPWQIESEAMEFALKEMEHHLPSDSQETDHTPQVLDAAMLFLKGHTPKK